MSTPWLHDVAGKLHISAPSRTADCGFQPRLLPSWLYAWAVSKRTLRECCDVRLRSMNVFAVWVMSVDAECEAVLLVFWLRRWCFGLVVRTGAETCRREVLQRRLFKSSRSYRQGPRYCCYCCYCCCCCCCCCCGCCCCCCCCCCCASPKFKFLG